MRNAFLLIACLLPLAAPFARPTIEVPTDLSQSAPVGLRITGLRPQTAVRIETRRGSADPATIDTAQATFTADRRGVIDTRTMAPVAGTYATVDAGGLFWSAQPTARSPDDPAEGSLAIVARSNDVVIATATTRTRPAPGLLHNESVPAFAGAVFCRPVGPGRYPAIVVLGGSEGGTWAAKEFAPLLAAKGYAVLGLPYYSPPYNPADRLEGLPESFTDIPVDRLAQVRAWLAGRADVDASRIGIWGVSKGAEFALIAASRYDWIKAVVAVVPSDVVWAGWGGDGPATASFAVDGRALAYVPYVGMDDALGRAARGEPMGLRAVHVAGRLAHPETVAAARIPIERYRGPLLLVGGGRDAIWPSADMARAVAESRKPLALPTRLLVYPDAGHGLGGPGTDPVAALSSIGGTPEANAAARTGAWRATFVLFDHALRSRRAP